MKSVKLRIIQRMTPLKNMLLTKIQQCLPACFFRVPFKLSMPMIAFVLLSACASSAEVQTPVSTMGESRLIEEPVFSSRVRVFTTGEPKQPTVVLLHGLGYNGLNDWQYLIPALKSNYHVIAIDLPGFGQSDKPNVHYSPDNYSLVLKHILNTLTREPVTIIGHSLGGAVALRYAARFPEAVKNLILVDVAGVLYRTTVNEHILRLEPDSNNPLAKLFMPAISVLNAITRGLAGGYGNATVQNDIYEVMRDKELRTQYFGTSPAIIAAICLVWEDFSLDINVVDTPTLIIWSSNDNIAPIRTGFMLEYRLPNAKMKIMERSGHAPMRTQPEQFNHIVLTALAYTPERSDLYPPVENAVISSRVASCLDDDSKREFSGNFNAIYIRNCDNVHISDTTVEYLSIDNSVVTVTDTLVKGQHLGMYIEDSVAHISNTHITADNTALLVSESKFQAQQSRIEANGSGMVVRDSLVELTGLDINGNLALVPDGSVINAAGVHLNGKTHAVYASSPQKLMFSVSTMKDKNIDVHVHGPTAYDPEERY